MNDLAKELINKLIDKKLKISTAESCTGGLLSAMLTDVPGASEVIDECIVTYANSAKIRELKVSEETLNTEGAVSYDTAYQMAKGICEHTKADVGVGITGIAGPGGGTKDKPVGTVFVGINIKSDIEVFEFHFSGDRQEVRNKTCNEVMKILANRI